MRQIDETAYESRKSTIMPLSSPVAMGQECPTGFDLYPH
jgi:hypothetical protein